jgi:hypothetical protein
MVNGGIYTQWQALKLIPLSGIQILTFLDFLLYGHDENYDIVSEHPQTSPQSEADLVCESLAEIVSYSYSVRGGGSAGCNIQQL